MASVVTLTEDPARIVNRRLEMNEMGRISFIDKSAGSVVRDSEPAHSIKKPLPAVKLIEV